jgi:putative membrane protein
MKRPVLFAAALAALSVSASAALTSADEQSATKQQPRQQQQQQQPAGATLSKSDREFVDRAAIGNLYEVTLGQAALQRAESPDVKRFAQRMIDDHSAATTKLAEVARAKGVILPQALDPKHQGKVDKLSKKRGAEFDRDYMKDMVDDHKSDVDEFEKASRDSKDPDIKGFAASTLPTLQEHLTMAKQLRDKQKGK